MSNDDLYGYDWLDNRFVAITTFRTAEFLEDQGWEAVPLVPLPPETPSMGISVRPDQPPPNVLVDIKDAAVRAGLSEISYTRLSLTPRQPIWISCLVCYNGLDSSKPKPNPRRHPCPRPSSAQATRLWTSPA